MFQIPRQDTGTGAGQRASRRYISHGKGGFHEVHNPTVRGQVLGEELRVLRIATHLTLEDASWVINCSPSKLSRIETGHRNASIEEVASLLGLYRADQAKRTRVLTLARETDDIGWLQTHHVDPGQHQHALPTLESKADQIIHFAPVVIPQLLRTSEYTRALRAEATAKDSIDDKVTRLPCRSILKRRQPPETIAFVNEAVLRRPSTGRNVLRRQLEHLHVAATQEHWTIRVIPDDQKIATGAFTLLRIPDRSPVVHLEHLTCSLFLEQPHDIDAYEQALQHLENNALDATDSLDLIDHVAKSLATQHGLVCDSAAQGNTAATLTT